MSVIWEVRDWRGAVTYELDGRERYALTRRDLVPTWWQRVAWWPVIGLITCLTVGGGGWYIVYRLARVVAGWWIGGRR